MGFGSVCVLSFTITMIQARCTPSIYIHVGCPVDKQTHSSSLRSSYLGSFHTAQGRCLQPEPLPAGAGQGTFHRD